MKYTSCEWVESRVVLDLTQLKFCCIGHSGNKGYVPMVDYQGGPLPVDAIRQARKDLIAANNDPKADSGCKGCHFLKKKDWDAERKSDALFDQVYVSSFSICNLSCRYCFVYLREFTEVSNVKGYDLLPVFEEMIEKGYLSKDSYIEWGGGEPTITKGFAEVMQLLLKQGYSQQIHSSSVKFSQEVEDGLRSGHVRAVTSVDAGTRESYEAVKGRDKFEEVWETVGRYAATGGDMTVKYIIRYNNSSPENIRGFVAKCVEKGVEKIVATPDFREMTQELLSEESLYAFALMEQLAKENGLSLQLRDEYVNPKQMKLITKYIPLSENEEKYRLNQEKAAEEMAAAEAAREARRIANAPRTAEAIKQAESRLEGAEIVRHPFQLLSKSPEEDAAVLELLDYQTQNPDPELREKLTDLLRTKSHPNQLRSDRIRAMGISADSWTVDGQPGYVIVDATDSPDPVSADMWFTCWAGANEYPIQLTISDGTGEDVVHSYLEPIQLRVSLPEVPAGESGIFSVRTDKTWRPTSGVDTRNLGVRIETKI